MNFMLGNFMLITQQLFGVMAFTLGMFHMLSVALPCTSSIFIASRVQD